MARLASRSKPPVRRAQIRAGKQDEIEDTWQRNRGYKDKIGYEARDNEKVETYWIKILIELVGGLLVYNAALTGIFVLMAQCSARPQHGTPPVGGKSVLRDIPLRQLALSALAIHPMRGSDSRGSVLGL